MGIVAAGAAQHVPDLLQHHRQIEPLEADGHARSSRVNHTLADALVVEEGGCPL